MNKFFCITCLGFFTCPPGSCTEVLPTNAVERWALKNSKITSPEEIIVAAIVQSFAKYPEQWEDSNFIDAENAYSLDPEGIGRLKNATKYIIIERKTQCKYNPNGPNNWYRFTDVVTVNTGPGNSEQVPLAPAMSKFLVSNYVKYVEAARKAKEAAVKAEAAMSLNERAWNLVEHLLDMKRENGALVPKNPITE